MKKVFLKLDGIKGESQAARHAGAIEVSSFYWGDGRTAALSIGKRRPLAAKDGLTIIKRTDNTTPDFLVAALTGQRFQGILTLEDYTASENLVRSIVFELETVFVRSVTEIKSGEVINLRYKTIRLLRSGKGNADAQRNGEKRFGVDITIMKKNLVILSIFLFVLAFCLTTVAKAQFDIKLPDIKVKKPDTKIKDGQTTTGGGQTNNVKTNNSGLLYPFVAPTNVPVLLKTSVDVSTVVHDEYWKKPNEKDYSSWVPKIRFQQYYNEERTLNYTVEYFNPNGALWFGETLESSGRSAERTVFYESPSPYANGALDTKSTDAVGVFAFKITDQDTKQVLFQGKFKVGKFSRAYRAEEKNKAGFFVEHDWLMPFAMIGFHHSIDDVGAMMPELSVWLKGAIEKDELEGRVFYNGRQIASTKDEDGGGITTVEERIADYAAAFEQQDKVWKRWQFNWANFRVHNNGGFNPENFPRAHFADKNPGEYTFKIYRSGTPIRELAVTVGADGRFVAPAYSSRIPLPYYRLILPVKIIGNGEKWNPAAWKTDAFYGNPLEGFAAL
jgi:type VI protein secretion system component Hcp